MTSRANRRAIIRLGENEIRALLNLPDGMRVIGVNANWPMSAVDVMVEDDRLSEVAPHMEPPILAGRWEMNGDGSAAFIAPDVGAEVQ